MTDGMSVFFNLYKIALRFEIGDNLFSCFVTVKSGIFAALFGYFALCVDNEYRIEIVTRADFKVVGVVSGSDLYRARAEFLFDVFVGNDGNFSADKRENELFADFVLIALIIGIDGDSRIAEERFGTGRRDDYLAAAVRIGIADVPECALFVAVFNLCVGESRLASGTDIAYAEASVNRRYKAKRTPF